ncbi:class I SAM-dependent methyltransferase [Octadecabacter sp. G9-8]|uniref:Ribosomal RNA small subunit methyltransferase J n=1 Tax=Octadecabacter dasysiphoniae TaxID=2909341 RepID=A0ABS9CUZ8_9RHOB|nr:class I SAM-dependent methyltransferase [Octadecabacter dasysiphoniae]MCF2870592.1 class I SAM-dependent methyltransferase [Octadecabacter dasysiphoniae]
MTTTAAASLAVAGFGVATETPLTVDFVGGAVGHRLKFGGGRGQDLARAMGLKNGKTPLIVDATAGLGRDAFLLASLGADVTLIERSAQMYALLTDGMARAAAEGGEYADIISRMTLLHGDAKDLIPPLSGDAILIDPMHPPRKTKALVKRELRQVREIVGTDDDAADLLRVALEHAKQRVVLKWPAKADPMDGVRTCSHQIIGKSTRYDVFMIP